MTFEYSVHPRSNPGFRSPTNWTNDPDPSRKSGRVWAIAVKRISVGSALCRTALGAFVRAAEEMRQLGTFEFADRAIGFAELSEMLP